MCPWELILLMAGTVFELVLSAVLKFVEVLLFFVQNSRYICALLLIFFAIQIYLSLLRGKLKSL